MAARKKPNARLIEGYRLTTAEIIYHLPDFPSLLQSFVWQDFDVPPKFPALNKFLAFWEENLDGRLHSVKFASRRLVGAPDIRYAAGQFRLH